MTPRRQLRSSAEARPIARSCQPRRSLAGWPRTASFEIDAERDVQIGCRHVLFPRQIGNMPFPAPARKVALELRAREPVAVIGHEAWQRLFDGDPSAVGRTVRLGTEHAAVVGVMPPGFGFPVNAQIWTPLRARAVDHERGEGPRLITFGRLAPGRSLEDARAELEVIGQRLSAEFPETHEHLRPAVHRFMRGSDMAGPALLLNVPFLLFLLVVSDNVATLLFALTATRESEIAVRSALGASRRRIVLQLVAKAVVLTTLGAGLGLATANWGMGWGMDLFWQVQQMTPPYWFTAGVSLPTVLYAFGLALRCRRCRLRREPLPARTGGRSRPAMLRNGPPASKAPSGRCPHGQSRSAGPPRTATSRPLGRRQLGARDRLERLPLRDHDVSTIFKCRRH